MFKFSVLAHFLFFACVGINFNLNALANGNDSSESLVYELPTLTDEKPDYHTFKQSFLPTKQVNHQEVFNKFINCFPSRSNFEFDLTASAGLKSFASESLGGQDRFYSQIVATMPLFSTNENYRAQEVETGRRKDLSKLIASLTKEITKRNLAIRKIALYESLERREQLRVRTGLAFVGDQVTYLEKIANAYQDKFEAISDIEGVRLQLVSQCVETKARGLDEYIVKIINEMD
jgi:hypothetical protein